MSLHDIMSQAGLAIYAEIALVIFLVVFVGIVIHVMRRKNRDQWQKAKHMPLDDEHPQEPRPPSGAPRHQEAASHE